MTAIAIPGHPTRISPASDALTADLRAIEAEYPGWHLFVSDEGQIWAVTCECHYGGSGTTLEAPTPALMRREIACEIRDWARAA